MINKQTVVEIAISRSLLNLYLTYLRARVRVCSHALRACVLTFLRFYLIDFLAIKK